MARKKMIAGNWKMNGLLADGVELAKGVAAEVKAMGKPECEFLHRQGLPATAAEVCPSI